MNIIVQDINCPVSVRLDILKSKPEIKSQKIYDDNLRHLLKDRNCPEDILEYFINSDKQDENMNLNYQINIALNPGCPPRILEKMYDNIINKIKDFSPISPIWTLGSNYNRLITSIIENKNCTNYILKDIFKKSNTRFLLQIVSNSNSDPNLLREAFEVIKNLLNPRSYNNVEIRLRLAERLDCPKDILINLSNDSEITVKLAAANNPNLPSDISKNIFLILSRDYNWKNAVANSLRCPVEILYKLKNDSIPSVRNSAEKTLKKLGL